MIVPCPRMRRGTDAAVPRPPGLVSEMLAPTRSSAPSVFVRAFSTSASYAETKAANGIRPASEITGTISVREPSRFSTSTASPRFTCPSRTRWGFPSISAKWSAITGISCAARAIA